MVMESILKKMIRAPLVNLKSIQDKSERFICKNVKGVV